MQSNLRPLRRQVAFALALGALALALFAAGALAAGGGATRQAQRAAKVRGCGSFQHQADAQAYLLEIGGSREHPIRRLDPDGDGVACEGLPAPYAGFATLGYNRRRGFLYGTVTMPHTGGSEPYPCLSGNTHFLEGPRLFNVYRVSGKRSRRLFPAYGLGAEARSASGRLLWRANRKQVPRGRYYVEFENRIATSPYAETECPGFSSAMVELP